MFYIHGYRHGGVGWIQRGDTDRWEGFREGGYRTGWGYRPRGIQAGGGGGGGSWDKQTPTVETKCLFGNQTND